MSDIRQAKKNRTVTDTQVNSTVMPRGSIAFESKANMLKHVQAWATARHGPYPVIKISVIGEEREIRMPGQIWYTSEIVGWNIYFTITTDTGTITDKIEKNEFMDFVEAQND